MSSRARFLALRDRRPAVLPSLLLCDFGRLADEIKRLDDAGADALHLDVMDGRFVPNMTYGLSVVEAARRATNSLLDVHLMIVEPGDYAERFVSAGADAATIHYEAAPETVGETLSQIQSHGAAAGLAINPDTPVDAVESLLGGCDFALVMSVEPGFGGQSFDRRAIDKLRRLRTNHPDFMLEVDGGVDPNTAGDCFAAGADLLVAGSAIFGSADYTRNVADLRSAACAAVAG